MDHYPVHFAQPGDGRRSTGRSDTRHADNLVCRRPLPRRLAEPQSPTPEADRFAAHAMDHQTVHFLRPAAPAVADT